MARVVLACLVLVLPSACAPWQTRRALPQAVVEQSQPRSVRLSLRSDETVVLLHPRVVGDSLVGSPPGSRATRSVALDEILAVEVRRNPVERTAQLGFLVLGTTVSATILLALLLGPLLAPP